MPREGTIEDGGPVTSAGWYRGKSGPRANAPERGPGLPPRRMKITYTGSHQLRYLPKNLQGTAVVGQSGTLDGIRMAEVSVPTYNATIYIGLKERASGQSATAESLSEYLQAYVSTCGRDTPAGCITVTPTKFVSRVDIPGGC
jgi:hypothetical protein